MRQDQLTTEFQEALGQQGRCRQSGARRRTAKMDLHLDVSTAALAEIAKVGFDPVFGARPLKRAIRQRLETPWSERLLDGGVGPEDTMRVETGPIRSPGQFSLSHTDRIREVEATDPLI